MFCRETHWFYKDHTSCSNSWHFSSTAEEASRNEVASTRPQTEFRFLITWSLSALQQEIIDHNRNGLLIGILSGLVAE